MTQLIVCRGLVASGKSTWAKAEQVKDQAIVQISKDELRAALHGSKWSRENERQVIRIEEAIVRDALAHLRTVIVADTNGNQEHIRRWEAVAGEFGVELIIKDFPVGLDEAIRRDAARAKPVGEKIIRRMAHQFPGSLKSTSGWVAPYTPAGEAVSRWRVGNPKGNLWFTADIHVNHDRCAAWRGFYKLDENGELLVDEHCDAIGDSETMNNVIRLDILSKVKEDDLVIVLGDVAMSKRVESLKWYDDLPGTWAMVPGNHDHCGPWNPRQEQLFHLYREHFDYILPPITEMTLKNGQYVTLCHFPRGTLDHTDEPRFLEYRPADDGGWLLHGHTHSQHVHEGPRMIHVGVDAWGMGLASEDDVIAEILSEQEFMARESA